MTNKIPIWLCLIISFLVGVLGFFGGVASVGDGRGFLSDLFATETPARTKNPKNITRPTYSLEYPSNWEIDDADPEFDLDHYVTIESSGTSYVWLMFSGPELLPEDSAASQVELFSEDMLAVKVSEFSNYGDLEGVGKQLTGRYFGHRLQVNVFSALDGEVGVTIVEFVYVQDLPLSKPGFDLVRRSLRLIPKTGT